MTSTSTADGSAEPFGRARWQGRCGGSMRWRPWEVGAVVIGFMIWWPVGLALLAMKMAQRRGFRFEEAMAGLRGNVERFTGGRGGDQPQWRPFASAPSGNTAFDEWRKGELARLEEERAKLDAAQKEFAEHLETLRKARDREEFEAFMRARGARGN